jgi:hypothetical protein
VLVRGERRPATVGAADGDRAGCQPLPACGA